MIRLSVENVILSGEMSISKTLMPPKDPYFESNLNEIILHAVTGKINGGEVLDWEWSHYQPCRSSYTLKYKVEVHNLEGMEDLDQLQELWSL